MTTKEKYGPAISLMSPSTLASWIIDLRDHTDVVPESETHELDQLLIDELNAIVGEEEAGRMMLAAENGFAY